jgi:6-pyruvoyltetrahydropterin/6-carboxytetrahydropterin synthase
VTSLTRQYRFSASHRLHSRALSDQANRDTYGKCNNPHGHGHDYILRVTATGHTDPDTGVLLAVPQLDALVEREVLGHVRDRNLNDWGAFGDLVPTTESLAAVVHRLLAAAWAGPPITSVKVLETRRNSVESRA